MNHEGLEETAVARCEAMSQGQSLKELNEVTIATRSSWVTGTIKEVTRVAEGAFVLACITGGNSTSTTREMAKKPTKLKKQMELVAHTTHHSSSLSLSQVRHTIYKGIHICQSEAYCTYYLHTHSRTHTHTSSQRNYHSYDADTVSGK